MRMEVVVPFASVFQERRLIEGVLRLRQHGRLAHPVALLIVTVATLARWLIDDHVVSGVPFITYYPAIILATFLCGFWPGILATVSSAAIAWCAFTPLNAAPERIQVISLLLFVAMSVVNVVLVGLLNAGLERHACARKYR